MNARKKIPGKKKSSDVEAKFRFILFVAGNEPNSQTAEYLLRNFCNKYLKEPYELKIIDVFKDYKSAIEKRITVVPTLIIEEPSSEKIIVGKIEKEDKLIEILGLRVIRSR